MTTPNKAFPVTRHDFYMAIVLARREVKDTFRDWRILTPIILLTLLFPALMNFTAGRMLNFVSEYGAEIIATQMIPFLLLVVGFFPMSFSLIALEAFVGEKERKSLEPLLATPLTDPQLYLGKMGAVLALPLLSAYLGMTVYVVSLYFNIAYTVPVQLFVQAIMLTTVQGIIMVAAAVIVSSQTTSVRAADGTADSGRGGSAVLGQSFWIMVALFGVGDNGRCASPYGSPLIQP
jgi:ABC-type Na+ efflux pump permease subunit